MTGSLWTLFLLAILATALAVTVAKAKGIVTEEHAKALSILWATLLWALFAVLAVGKALLS